MRLFHSCSSDCMRSIHITESERTPQPLKLCGKRISRINSVYQIHIFSAFHNLFFFLSFFFSPLFKKIKRRNIDDVVISRERETLFSPLSFLVQTYKLIDKSSRACCFEFRTFDLAFFAPFFFKREEGEKYLRPFWAELKRNEKH